MNPPLRSNFDGEALFDALKNGLIDILESDHAPHTLGEKDKEFEDTMKKLRDMSK